MSPRVADAMRRIDRALFIPNIKDSKVDYYFGLHAQDNPAYLVRCCLLQKHLFRILLLAVHMPIPIGNQQTISAPHMHATALELLAENLQPGCSVLDVGSGAGPPCKDVSLFLCFIRLPTEALRQLHRCGFWELACIV